MIYVLIFITLTRMPSPPYGVKVDLPPAIVMQEFNDQASCQSASLEIGKRIPKDQWEFVKMACVPKGKK